MDQVQYWDVFPKSIKVSKNPFGTIVPLSVRGNPRGSVVFESSDAIVASVDTNGTVSLGMSAGSAVITAYDSEDRTSIRYVLVEVTTTATEIAVA